MAEEAIQVEETKKKVQRRIHKMVYVVVDREDPSKYELCFDQEELMKKMLSDPEFLKNNYPISIDTDKLYH